MPPGCRSETLRTRRLVLRAARRDDLTALHEVFSDPLAMRYWDRPPFSRDETAGLLDYMMTARGGHEFIVERDGRVIGKAGCWQLPEVGYILHPRYWGRGYATEAVGAALADVFAAYPDLDRITADIDPRNGASARVLHKLGFVETHRARATVQVAGTWCDSIYFALARNALKPPGPSIAG
ncbi:MAG: GNAT family N-acetyltransferase [Rhodobacteraceae bacterium]|nr:GNAT family N-acetyltransferase [Paracoccaceae bacterium]